MTMMPATDDRQRSTNNMMLWMMPMMLAFFSFTFPSGLALYWVASNAIGVTIQYFITGWGPLFAKATPAAAPTPPAAQEPESKELASDGTANDVRKNRRRGNRGSAERARRRPGRGEVEILSRGKPGFLGFGAEPAGLA